MVALGVVAVVTLLVVGVLARLLNTGGKSAHQVAAMMLAQEVLEEAAKAGPPNWSFSTSKISDRTGERELRLPGDESSTPFGYKLDVLRLRKSPDDLGTMTQLVVTVWWWGDEPGSRAELGKSSVSLARTVYIRGETGL